MTQSLHTRPEILGASAGAPGNAASTPLVGRSSFLPVPDGWRGRGRAARGVVVGGPGRGVAVSGRPEPRPGVFTANNARASAHAREGRG